MDIHLTYLVPPIILVILSIAAIISTLYRHRWELVIPLGTLFGVYLYATIHPGWNQDERQFYVRWSLALLLTVISMFGAFEKLWGRKYNGK